jgi:RNA polymerase sigma factor (TIGR02999 family)
MSDVTHDLGASEEGDPHAGDRLLPLVYAELRRLAARRLDHEPSGQTLQPTALVHEAYLRLLGEGANVHWNSRGHFFAAAAEAMRRILVENARYKRRLRHGGGRKRLDLDGVDVADDVADERLLDLDEALAKLAAEESEVAEVVKLRYFVGLTIEQSAEVLGISVRTANRHWAYARAWLHGQLKQSGEDPV